MSSGLRFRLLASALALAAAPLAVPLAASPRVQAPDAPWITFATAHYRIHCPRAFEPFGRDVAGRVEALHARYLELVGYAHPGPIDILILDPRMEANGMALPFLQRPHVVLWRTEPEADSQLAHHRGWAELLVAHELGHMHHLLRPAQKPGFWTRWMAVLGPVAEKTPRWVKEGYATLLEGQLTGSGRPHSAFRAAVLRQWALEGKLPPYEALDATGGFLGGSQAYLVGSAYLAWLEAKAGDPAVFRTLWTRLAGTRDFEAAFAATFGFGPRDGYQRFCAELTHAALDLERRAQTEGLREGEIVTRVDGWVSDLALSPDGTRLLARVLDRKRPGLYVWDLTAPVPAPRALPGEPPDRAPRVPTLPARRLPPIHGALPRNPVWIGSREVGFQLPLPNGEGVLEPRAYRWIVGGGLRAARYDVPPAASGGPGWKEVGGIWNLVDAAGRPLTRTLAAAWNPVATPDGKWIYFARLSAAGVEIRRLDATQPPLEAAAPPADAALPLTRQVLPPEDAPPTLPPPASVEPHAYRVAETHSAFAVAGYGVSPAGTAFQVGAGGNDILGRLNWQALAGFGDGAGPRGLQLGAAWRGWRWAPSFQVFSSLERPSSQRFAPVSGFDRERRGGELALTWETQGRPQARLRPFAAFERVDPMARGEARNRAFGGLEAGWGEHWGLGDHALVLGLGFRGGSGATDGHAWSLGRAGLSLGWVNPAVPLRFQIEGGRMGGEPTALDRFHLGGLPTSLVPEALDLNRAAQAALPAYSALGDRLVRLRGEAQAGPLAAYVEHTAVWDDGAPRPAAARVVGVELDSRRLGLPADILRRVAGNLRFTLGIHRPLDGPMKQRTVGTLSVIVRP